MAVGVRAGRFTAEARVMVGEVLFRAGKRATETRRHRGHSFKELRR